MTKTTRTIVIDSIGKLEKALVEGHLIASSQGSFSHKTVSVTFQLRVPRKMRAGDIKTFVNIALAPGAERPDGFGQEISVYKQRVEVFMP